VELERAVRAFDPFPGAVCSLDGTMIKIWRSAASEGIGAPGTVLAATPDGIVVACGESALRLLTLQQPGSKRLSVADFLHGFAIKPGDVFALPAE
jgi:methionyl-tRNA formyltransferase